MSPAKCPNGTVGPSVALNVEGVSKHEPGVLFNNRLGVEVVPLWRRLDHATLSSVTFPAKSRIGMNGQIVAPAAVVEVSREAVSLFKIQSVMAQHVQL
jgi:hypothetical protein